MPPLLTAVLLGFVVGLQHATDPDHLVAVGTILSRERRFADGAVVGALWGLGHTATLVLAGSVTLALDLRPGPVVGTGLELVVATMLVALGLVRLRDALGDLRGGRPGPALADHDHDGAEVVHRHPHPHVHPSRRLLKALGQPPRRVAIRAVTVGAVHGLAGSAVVSMLVLATLPTMASAVAYLLVFGGGTLVGMTALTAAVAYPVKLALRWRRARWLLSAGAGVGSIAFGVVYALRAF